MHHEKGKAQSNKRCANGMQKILNNAATHPKIVTGATNGSIMALLGIAPQEKYPESEIAIGAVKRFAVTARSNGEER